MLDSRPYDLCVVGSGVAGALVATAAVRKGLRVVILEAGRRFDFEDRLDQIRRHQVLNEPLWPWARDDRDSFVDTSKEAIGHEYDLNTARAKGVGGSTLAWGGMLMRFQESDFRTASTYGLGVDWPIDYAELEPYYCLAEEELGVSGTPSPTYSPRSKPFPMPAFPHKYEQRGWEKVADKLGLTFELSPQAKNSQPYDGRSPCVAYAICEACPSGARYSADFHIRKIENADNCTLLTETVARRVEVNNSGKVTAIHASGLDGKEYEIKASRYVIAAHGVETARILLLSDVGNHSDHVGRYLQEHWYLAAAGNHPTDRVFPGRIGFETTECNDFYEGAERQERGALRIEFYNRSDPLYKASQLGLWGKQRADYDCNYFGHWISLAAEIEHQSNPESRVTLDPNQKDLFGDPVPHIHFALTDIDRRTHERAHQIIETLLHERGVPDVERTHNWAKAPHHQGTCRMHDDPTEGVVDRNCRVHGTDNLYLAGSSVFPSSGGRQPTLTIAALAIRLGEHLTSTDGGKK
jgi:choline dehydrogenase-like flavoprotein